MSNQRDAADDMPCCLPRYLSAVEAVAYLRLSLSWIRKATRRGTIPCARTGTRVVYDRLDLDALAWAQTRVLADAARAGHDTARGVAEAAAAESGLERNTLRRRVSTVLDACEMLGVAEYIGFDLRPDPRVRERHAARFVEFDATNASWDRVCPQATAGLIVVTPPQFTFGRSAETDAATDLGRFSDPDAWLAAMEHVITGATGALMVGGALAVTVRATAEFENGAPVPDLRTEVGGLLAEAGLEFFLGNPFVSVGRSRVAPHPGAWLRPEIDQIIIMRKS